MQHRHLNHSDYTPAAIDDVIGRGNAAAWVELREALRTRPDLRASVLRVTAAYAAEPSAQRHHLWNLYAKNTKPLPDWERLLAAAVGVDADHVLTDLRGRFDDVLAQLESVAGWRTARVNRPVFILGSLDGIETGIRQLIRDRPLEINVIAAGSHRRTLPTPPEILRIKAVLILRRNATRDYLDFVALSDRLGAENTAAALASFDTLYPQTNGESPLAQLAAQLARPLPYDLADTRLAEYKHLDVRWHDWAVVAQACADGAVAILENLRAVSADEAWLFENAATLASVRRGLEQATRRETHNLGDFSKYTKD